MIQDQMISADAWLNVLLYYRGAPHQQQAALQLFNAIRELHGGACILNEHAEWLATYRSRDKLVHSAMHPEGQ